MKPLVVALLLLVSPESWALGFSGGGNSVGNGAYALVCGRGTKTTVQALDVVEGQIFWGHQYVESWKGQPAQLAEFHANRLDNAQGIRPGPDSIAARLRYVAKNLQFTPPGVALPETHDAKSKLEIPGCRLAQIVVFRRNNTVIADWNLWQLLSPFDQAAIYLHEAIYWYLRDHGMDTDSRRTRRAVAFLMSNDHLDPRKNFQHQSGQICSSEETAGGRPPATVFYAYFDEYRRARFEFLRIGGYQMLGRTLLTIPLEGAGPDPIDPGLEEQFHVAGRLESITNGGSWITLTWGEGKIELGGNLSEDVEVRDSLHCQPLAAGSLIGR